MQQPLNQGRQYITPSPNWRDLQSCTDYQYPFITSRRLYPIEMANLKHRLSETLKVFCAEQDRLFGGNS